MDRVEVMSDTDAKGGRSRVVLFGMRCVFTGPVLDTLCAAPDIDLAAVVLPGRAPERDPVRGTVRACEAMLVEVPDRPMLDGPSFRATLEDVAPDAIIVACFPWRLPRWLLELPPRGCLNLHPSLLPDGRGPEPVFWAYHRGLDQTGVTLHLMNEAFDAGPIIAQAHVPITEGATIPSLERMLAVIGVGLALDHLRGTTGRQEATPQPEGGEYAPHVRGEDLVVPTSWSARRAARFIHAAVPVYGAIPVLVLASGQRLMVDRVLGVEDGRSEHAPAAVLGETARIRFVDGMVTCSIVRNDRPLRLHP